MSTAMWCDIGDHADGNEINTRVDVCPEHAMSTVLDVGEKELTARGDIVERTSQFEVGQKR